MRRLALMAVLCLAAMLVYATVAGAQEDRDCDDFSSTEQATAALRPGDPELLDADDDGIACEDNGSDSGGGAATSSGLSPSRDRDCDDFSSTERATAALRPGDPERLDADDDGIACEDDASGAAATPASPTASPSPSPTPSPSATATSSPTASASASAAPLPDTGGIAPVLPAAALLILGCGIFGSVRLIRRNS